MFMEDTSLNIRNTGETPLSQYKKKEAGIVKRLLTADTKQVQKLLAMGIVPGRMIQIIQTYPVFILQVDNTQAAMDKELAGNIMMQE